ncbi:cytochrome P450 [Talaromyces proteolyticus]|uniref:Cytochrome P450 n=1 Tax=Talaromyces proteolyticus TaxID=1131652 RepID=A0AAD4L1K3_9EURO|nr:cytochrome P450 [Talaromyces proteolyticus]KAH8703845.1 cytochrome P450 [Talaromyces proteolyticus]
MYAALPLLATAVVLWAIYPHFKKRDLPLPPGPPGEPIIGHLRVIPQDHPEHQYTQWGKDYKSDILSFNVLGRPIVVVNSIEVAHDLLDKRGANYADRPRFVLFEVMGWGVTLTFLRWSPQFRLHRKLLQQSFTQSACKTYRPIQIEEARRAIKAILHQPEKWEGLLRNFSTAVVLRIGFGIDVQEQNDPYVKMAIDVEEATGEGGVPGFSIVDMFPLLRYLPSVCAVLDIFKPLAHARRTKASIQRLHDAPWDATEPLIRAGKATFPSFMRTHFGRYLENEGKNMPNEATVADLKGAAGAISIAGGNTTWSTIIVAILNLMLNPDIQAKAQAELDRVIGIDEKGDILRLPTFEDRAELKYLEHTIQETTRWAPLSPVGVPHATVEDDTYKGYHIPKGSVVFANAWAMTHDERYYSSPDEFNPDRYIPIAEGGKGEPFPEGPFGFGRRVCPGQHLALAGVYILLATLLATMDLKRPVDKDGNIIKQTVSFTNGLSGVPDTFQCVIKPRSEKARELLIQG